MTGKIELPGKVVWRDGEYAATLEGSFFGGYEVHLYWLNSSAGIWHDQSRRNGARIRFSSKSQAIGYANNDLIALKRVLLGQANILSAMAKDKNVPIEVITKLARSMDKGL